MRLTVQVFWIVCQKEVNYGYLMIGRTVVYVLQCGDSIVNMVS